MLRDANRAANCLKGLGVAMTGLAHTLDRQHVRDRTV